MYVRFQGLTYIHTCRSYVHTPRDFTNSSSLAWRLRRRISGCLW